MGKVSDLLDRFENKLPRRDKFESILSRRVFGRVANTLKVVGSKLDLGKYLGYVTIDDNNQILQFSKGGFHIRWDNRNGTIIGVIKFSNEVKRRIRSSAFKKDGDSYKYKGQSFTTKLGSKKIKDLSLSNLSSNFTQLVSLELNENSVKVDNSDETNQDFDEGFDEEIQSLSTSEPDESNAKSLVTSDPEEYIKSLKSSDRITSTDFLSKYSNLSPKEYFDLGYRYGLPPLCLHALKLEGFSYDTKKHYFTNSLGGKLPYLVGLMTPIKDNSGEYVAGIQLKKFDIEGTTPSKLESSFKELIDSGKSFRTFVNARKAIIKFRNYTPDDTQDTHETW